MFENLYLFVNNLDCSIDESDYDRLIELINLFRDSAFESKDSSIIDKCNQMIYIVNSVDVSDYNLYVRRSLDNLSFCKMDSYDS